MDNMKYISLICIFMITSKSCEGIIKGYINVMKDEEEMLIKFLLKFIESTIFIINILLTIKFGFDSPEVIVSYILGASLSYVASIMIERRLQLGKTSLKIIVSEETSKVVEKFFIESSYAVSKFDGIYISKDDKESKIMFIVEVNNKRKNKVANIIKEIDKSAIITE